MFNTVLRDQVMSIQVQQIQANNPSLSRNQAESIAREAIKARQRNKKK